MASPLEPAPGRSPAACETPWDMYRPWESSYLHDASGIHGMGHAARVLVWANLVGQSMLERGVTVDLEVVRWAASLHDVRRLSDGNDPLHGERCGAWIGERSSPAPGATSAEACQTGPAARSDALHDERLRLIAYCCVWHVPPDHEAPSMTPELTCLKDADALDSRAPRRLEHGLSANGLRQGAGQASPIPVRLQRDAGRVPPGAMAGGQAGGPPYESVAAVRRQRIDPQTLALLCLMTDGRGHAPLARSGPVNLTTDPPERVLSICWALAESGTYVLHGSNVRPALPRIEPRQANDAMKSSGNYIAVYGSLNVDVVLMHAILDKAYLLSRLKSYAVGYRIRAGRLVFNATDNLYQLFKQKDPQLFSDGYVYVLDRGCFVRSPESPSEFFALQPLEPLTTLEVSASLGAHLFRIDTPEGDDRVVPYSADETARLASHHR